MLANKKNLAVTLLLGAILLQIGAAKPCFAEADAGKVVTFNGDCLVVAGDRRAILKRGDTIHVGDAIDVPDDAKLKLLMVDGSVLSLAGGSKMTIKNYENDPATGKRDVQLSFDKGLLRSVVAKAGGGSKFEVETATGVAASRSTDWFVEAAPGETTVSVLEGAVAVARRDGSANPASRPDKPKGVGVEKGTAKASQDILLTSGSAAEIGAGRGMPRVRQRTAEEFNALIERGRIRFGWCQCITDRTVIRASCVPSAQGCAATCGGATSSYLPDAHSICAAFFGEVAESGTQAR